MNTKELIVAFYREFFNDHDLTAPLRYVCEDYIQHNPGVPQGRQGLIDAFAEKFRLCPDFHLEIEFIIVEDDMAAVYLKNKSPDGKTKIRVFDLYRISNGKLAEHWDVLQPVN